MKPANPLAFFGCAALLAAPSALIAQRPFAAQQQDPHLGYVYPAGAKAGSSLNVTIGGEFLEGVTGARFSDTRVTATIGKYNRPLVIAEVVRLKQKLDDARTRLQGENKQDAAPGGFRGGGPAMYMRLAKEAGITTEQLMALDQFRKDRENPKKQANPQIAETVALQITIPPEVPPGVLEIRLIGPNGLSNPLAFHVGALPERRETEPNDKDAGTMISENLPVVLNGQILPGDVDRFSFSARKGQRIVVAASARELIPHLADAVPGWFQATLTLFDRNGKEVSYVDDYHFDPDPVLSCEIPADGAYILEVRDAIYRGREDFVYRVILGDIPFVTGVFPLGGPADRESDVSITGWNLPADHLVLNGAEKGPGIHPVAIATEQRNAHAVPFAVDPLPEFTEAEPNDEAAAAPKLKFPIVVNGRIDAPGDRDVVAIECGAGARIVAEVRARRLNSPLDSLIRVTDARGRQLAMNDDYEDLASPLVTHHADSRIELAAPAGGTYYVHIADTQGKGGPAFAYRLHIAAQQPDFALRVVPSCVNGRPGTSVPITVHALRKDGFTGDIALALLDAPPGFQISGAWVPSGQDKIRLTLTLPLTATHTPKPLKLEGVATIAGREVRRAAVPAEDMMQAFAYHHLMPTREWLVAAIDRRPFQGGTGPQEGGPFRRAAAPGPAAAWLEQAMPPPLAKPIKLPPGGTAQLHIPTPLTRFLGNEVRVDLSDPPEGITIQKFTTTSQGIDVVFSAEAGKLPPGLKGNLILNAFTERTPPAPQGKGPPRTFRIPLGSLPAVPFEAGKS